MSIKNYTCKKLLFDDVLDTFTSSKYRKNLSNNRIL
ncbi:hypothetical protein FWK35_00005048 [Aphis craccivora]|uniref:Uncharacterized protein n=1 Tax=Aphis craccivora TaxID=307492 RepID=A0A6G0ZGA4_APHCR|nr:hypothetical protein FWK35_00005048 [Aphis craccivora]